MGCLQSAFSDSIISALSFFKIRAASMVFLTDFVVVLAAGVSAKNVTPLTRFPHLAAQ